MSKCIDCGSNFVGTPEQPPPEGVRCKSCEIERLKAELESHAWQVSPGMAQAKLDELNREVARVRMFWSQVDRKGDSCWEWIGWKDNKGYGQMFFEGKMRLVHRIAAFLSGMLSAIDFDGQTCVLHQCDNPACCNPTHLFIGTQQDNIADMNHKGRQACVTGDEHPCAKLSEVQFAQAMERIENGESLRSVAESLGVANQSLSKRIKRYNARLRARCGKGGKET